jgi:hypothetical protein
VNPTLFSDADMAKLAHANGVAGSEAAPNAPTMSCHRDQPGTAHAMRLCAGWLAVVGPHHLGVRMAILAGRLPDDALVVGQNWPELRESLNHLLDDRDQQTGPHSTSATQPEGASVEG